MLAIPYRFPRRPRRSDSFARDQPDLMSENAVTYNLQRLYWQLTAEICILYLSSGMTSCITRN